MHLLPHRWQGGRECRRLRGRGLIHLPGPSTHLPRHCLLVPKEHYETLDDLPGSLVGPLFTNVQMLSRGVELGLDADGTFVAINNRISQSVPHLHVHIVPRTRGDGLRGFFWPRQAYRDDDHIREVQEAIREAMGRTKAAN